MDFAGRVIGFIACGAFIGSLGFLFTGHDYYFWLGQTVFSVLFGVAAAIEHAKRRFANRNAKPS